MGLNWGSGGDDGMNKRNRDIDGKNDISKRIPVNSYGVYFNGLDYHGSYDSSNGFSIR